MQEKTSINLPSAEIIEPVSLDANAQAELIEARLILCRWAFPDLEWHSQTVDHFEGRLRSDAVGVAKYFKVRLFCHPGGGAMASWISDEYSIEMGRSQNKKGVSIEQALAEVKEKIQTFTEQWMHQK